MADEMVAVRGLVKRYGGTTAVNGISFTVEKGEIFALLGPNGSGKTTTLESLEGIRRPDAGSMSVAGIDPARQFRRLRDVIGVQLQTSALPASMTVEEAMSFFGAYHGVAPRMDLVERLGLQDKGSTQYGRLSVGLQRRLALAVAVSHDPEVVFLDEPTAGLDVQSRVELHDLVRELRDRGATVILATHDMAEAEKLADRAAILLKGDIAALGSPRQLTAAGDARTRISVSTENGSLREARAFPGAAAMGMRDEYAIFLSEDPGAAVAAILGFLKESGDILIDLRVERPTLEERFLEITSDAPRGGQS